MAFFNRYKPHLVEDTDNYVDQYGYDIEHLDEWCRANDPDYASMESLLSYTMNVYGHIVAACLALGVEDVLDIGCGCGQQSKMFAESGIEYTGLEVGDYPFYGEGRPDCSIVRDEYPACGNLGHSAAVSSHCVGTGLVWEPEAIADDFDVFVGHCYADFFDELAPFYDNFQIIEDENFAYHPEYERVHMMIAACWR